jgi:hypothetical protein
MRHQVAESMLAPVVSGVLDGALKVVGDDHQIEVAEFQMHTVGVGPVGLDDESAFLADAPRFFSVDLGRLDFVFHVHKSANQSIDANGYRRSLLG